MSVIIQLQNLPLSASSIDIRDFFSGLSIPPGGVHIVGGKKGSAFIAFANDEDARQAMGKNGRRIKDSRIKLALSSHRELKEVLEQLHKEQSDYEMSRKMRLSESRPERNRSHQKHRRSRSRSLERSRSHQEFNPDNQNSGGKYDDGLQRENPSMRQQSPYDRKLQYPESSGRAFLGTSGNDKPNPYVPSTYTSDPEEERNEEIRRRIETFIATFGQAENYNLDLKKDAYPNKAFKTGHDGFSQPGGKEGMHNQSQGYPSMQVPAENYQPTPFDDFDTRRHFDDLRSENAVGAYEVFQGATVPSVSTSHNERMPYGADDKKFSSQPNHNVLEDQLLNSPMDIEEAKNDNDTERFQSNQYFGTHMFNAPEEMRKLQGENVSVPPGSASFNFLPFQSFETTGADVRLDAFEKGLPESTSPDAAKDFCIKLEGLPYYTTENDIRRVFRDQSLFDMFIPYTSDGNASAIGFVQFSSAEDLLAAVKMGYCMIGDSRVEFRGSSRAALMEARMPSRGSVANVDLGSSYQDVLALKRTQDILSSMMSVRDPAVSATHLSMPPPYPPGPASYPVVPSSGQQQGGPPAKRSLCAVITGLPSHFTRHIQVLKCIEGVGINFHLIHLVLNNRSRFTGKLFAEFHDLRDLDAALKKHNQNVEGCTIGVKQVLHEEMMKFLSSHRSRCMYPTPKQPDFLEKKPEKAPYIWEPPSELMDMPSERKFPAVWSSQRAMENQRFVTSGDFYLQNEKVFRDESNRVQAHNRDFGVSNSYRPDPHDGGSHFRKTGRDVDVHSRRNQRDTDNSYSGFNKANESFQGGTDFFQGNSETSFSKERNRAFVASQSGEERGFNSRKTDSSNSQFSRSKRRERSCSPIHHGLRKDFPGDHKRFRNEKSGNDENPEVVFLDARYQTRHHHDQQKNQDFVFERKDKEFKTFSTDQTAGDLKIDIKNPSEVKEAGSTPIKRRSDESAFSQKDSIKTHSPTEQSLKHKHGGKSSLDTSPRSQKKRFEHRKNCPKRQKVQRVEAEVPKSHDRSRANDCPKSDEHPRRNNRSRSNDRPRSDDHLRPVDLIRSSDRPRHNNRSRSRDRLRSIDHVKSDDRPRRNNRSRSGDRLRPMDYPRPDDRSGFDDRSRPSERSRPNDHSRHRSGHKEFRKETLDVPRPEELFQLPDCVLEATNVDPHLGVYELLDFFRGYGLCSENFIRRYTDTGEPTSDLRIAFHHPEDANQAYKILNRQYLKGRAILLSFVELL